MSDTEHIIVDLVQWLMIVVLWWRSFSTPTQEPTE